MYTLQLIDPIKNLEIIRKVAKVRGQVCVSGFTSHERAADNRGQRSASFYPLSRTNDPPRTTADNKKPTKHAAPRTTADIRKLSPQSRGQPRTTADKAFRRKSHFAKDHPCAATL